MGQFEPVGQEEEVDSQCTDTPSVLSVISLCVSPGIFYTAAIVGPAAGYLLGGYFLNIYTEIHLT